MPLLTLVNHLGTWGQTHRWWLLVAMVTLCLVLLLGATGRRRTAATTHGSAQWATRQDMRQAGLLGNTGVFLGRQGRARLWSGRGHVLLCAPTGGGKDLTVNFPTTRAWPHSMLIVDVKDRGENYEQCRQYRPGVVWRFAPTLQDSCRLNLLAHIAPHAPDAFRECAILAESLLAPRARGVHASDSGEYFRHQAAGALRDVTLHVLQTRPQASFPMVLAQMAEVKPLLAAMAQSNCAPVRQTGQHLGAMQRQSERQFLSIWDTAMGGLDVFKDPVIARCTTTSDFALTDLQGAAYPVTLYLGAQSPTELLYLAPLYRAVLESGVHQLMLHQGDRRELLFLCNEFPTLGYLRLVEQTIALARSPKMRFLLVVQDLGQLWETYGQYTALWGNCGVRIFYAPTNDLTAKRMSEMLGPGTVGSAGTSAQGLWGRRTRSQHDSGRPLMTEAEVLGMSRDEAIVWVEGCPHPLLVEKCWEG
jgi:type IV secretion system protein VirD4